MRLMTGYPYALVGLYACALLITLAFRPKFAPLSLALIVAGAMEFAICTLADAVDTHRHLFLFHVITDTLVLLSAGWLLTAPGQIHPELP